METIKLDLIPGKKMPSLHASQYDDGREHGIDLFENGVVYKLDGTETLTINERKGDDCICSLDIENTFADTNHIVFSSTEQMCAVWGNNICELVIAKGEKTIGTLNFILEVEPSPTENGIESESEIKNLERQIEEITEEVIGDDYYTKTQTDEAIATAIEGKADTTYVDEELTKKADKTDTYTKSQVDTKLDAKANANSVYTKTQVDNKLSEKADVTDLPDMSQYYDKSEVDDLLDDKADKSDTYTKEEVDDIVYGILPDDTASGSVANFETDLALPLKSLKAEINATGGNGTPDNPIPINGYTEANITRCGVNLYSGVWSEYRKPVNYYIKNIPLKIGTTYTLRATLKDGGTSVSGCFVGVANNGEQYSEFGTKIPCVIIDGTTMTQTFIPNNLWISPKLIIYVANEAQFNSLFENYEISLVEGKNTTYTPYNGQTYTIAFGQTVYGGVLDVTRGLLRITHGYIASYNGEVINEPWISSMDEYSQGATPTTGAQVVYPLTTPVIIDLPDGEPIITLNGTNNIYADTGETNVVFKCSVAEYVANHSGGSGAKSLGGVFLGGSNSSSKEEPTEDTEEPKEEPKEVTKTLGDEPISKK